MSGHLSCVLELLHEDMVSHGQLVQCIEQQGGPAPNWKDVVAALLSCEVEMGEAKLASTDYVEFIAWTGTVDERVLRAAQRVASLASRDREFAYWLALRKNVDRFEENS